MTAADASFDDVVLAVPVTTPYVRYSDEPAAWHVARCLRTMLERSGIAKAAVDGLAVSSFTLPPDPVAALSRALGLSPRWLESVPFGGASGVIALRRALRAVQGSDAEIVACIGADANPRNGFTDLVSRFSWAAIDGVHPYGAAGPSMPFAHLTSQYMAFSGARREDFARLSVASRRNAAAFDGALLGTPVTEADYLAARAVAGPLHLLDLVMPCAGAEGFFVMRASRARKLGLRHARVRATSERHNAFADDSLIVRGGWAQDADALYDRARVSPQDIDVVAMYDDYPAIVFMQIEALKFCAAGGAPEFVRQHSLGYDGDFPLNTNGGQLGCGQAGAAGGYLGMVEVLRQITGQAGRNQVEGARAGLVSGYGMAVYDRCLATAVAILEGGRP